MLDWLQKDEVRYLVPPLVLLLILSLVLVIMQHRQRRDAVLRLRSDSGGESDPRQRLVAIIVDAIALFSGFLVVLHLLNLLFLPYPRYEVDFDIDDLISSIILLAICVGLHWLNKRWPALVRYALVVMMTVFVITSTSPDYLFEQRGAITLAIPLVVAGALLSFAEMLVYLVVTVAVYAFLPSALLENYTGDYFVIIMLLAIGTTAAISSSTLSRAIDRERTLRKTQESMLRTVSHEMRTPVVALRGFWTALQMHRASVDLGPLDQLVGSIEQQTEYLHQLVERVVWFASAGRNTLPVQQVDLAEIARITVAQMDAVAAESGMELAVAGADGPLPVQATSEVQTLAVNLIDNAIKHSGGTRVEIAVSRDAAGIPTLTVRDNGRGMPAPETIGQPWTHHDVAVRGDLSRGYGLGLTIVEDICRRNSAEITVSSEEPGLRVTVRFLPRRDRLARLKRLYRATAPKLRRR